MSKYRLRSIITIAVFTTIALTQTISVQGVLRDPLGKTVEDGGYDLTLKLYTQAVEGTPVWEEELENIQTLHGIFSLELGSVTPLNIPFNTTYYLGITVGTDPEIEPRLKLLKAPSSMSMSGAQNVIPSDGNIGFGTTEPQAGLHITTTETGMDLFKVEGSSGGIKSDATGDVYMEGGGAIKFEDGSRLTTGGFNGIATHVRSNTNASVTVDANGDGIGSVQFYVGDSLKMEVNAEGVAISGATALGAFPGSMIIFSGDFVPTGWLLCDGSEYSIAEYPDLYDAIGTSFGSGTGTFNVPDMRGKGAKGFNASTAEFDTLGESSGSETHTLIEDEMTSHYHTINPPNISIPTEGLHTHTLVGKVPKRNSNPYSTFGPGVYEAEGDDGLFGLWSFDSNGNHAHSAMSPPVDTDSKGGGAAHNILHPYLAVNYIIKY